MLGTLLQKRYEILQKLSHGAFGCTYLAEDTHFLGNPLCVVKQLQPYATDPENLKSARRMFASEAQVLKQLGVHSQIPEFIDYFEEDGEFYLIQEFVEGHPLSEELIPGQRWSESAVIALLLSILEPLSFVHKERAIHRDIKPANLMRRKSDGKIVLIDFGAVKHMTTKLANSQSKFTVTIGTPGYMPSEQSQGSPKFSSDLYSLGIVAIEALTGLNAYQFPEDPYSAEISWRNYAKVTPWFGDFIDKLVHFDFRDRYPSAVEALNQLKSKCSSPATVKQYTKGYSPTLPLPAPQPTWRFPIGDVARTPVPHYTQKFDLAIHRLNAGFLWQWIIGSTLGTGVGVLGVSLLNLPNLFGTKAHGNFALAFSIFMLAIALPQSLLLRSAIDRSWQWLLAGTLAGAVMGTVLDAYRGLVLSNPSSGNSIVLVTFGLFGSIGSIVGLFQWFVLQPIVPHSGKFVRSSAIGWIVGLISAAISSFALSKAHNLPLLSILVASLVWSFFTGKCLAELLSNRS